MPFGYSIAFWSFFQLSLEILSLRGKYGVFSGPYFPVFGLNTGEYGPENTPYLDNFHAVWINGGWGNAFVYVFDSYHLVGNRSCF